LHACSEIFGMKKSELFEAFDLFDVRDFGKVRYTFTFNSKLHNHFALVPQCTDTFAVSVSKHHQSGMISIFLVPQSSVTVNGVVASDVVKAAGLCLIFLTLACALAVFFVVLCLS